MIRFNDSAAIALFLHTRKRETIDCDYDCNWLVAVNEDGFPIVDENGFTTDAGEEWEQLPLTPYQAMILAIA